MRTVKFQLLQADRWDQFVDSSPDTWLNHSSSWIEIEERFFVNANLSFAILDDDEVVAIQPLFLSEGAGTALGERLLHSGIHRHTGLALPPDLSVGRANAAKHAAMKEILALAEVYDVDRIQLNSHNLTSRNRSGSRDEIPFWVERYGFQLGVAFGPGGMAPCPGVATLNADQLLDLEPPTEVLFQNLRDRASVRQAMKQNLAFEITSDVAVLKDYMAIAEASSARTGEPIPQDDYYYSVLNCFGPRGKVHIAFVLAETVRVAGLILLTDKGAASYFANVSLPNSLHLRPNDFLHWSAILWAKNAGLRTYRFGPSFPEVPREWPISRVSSFKTKFGSRSVPIIQGSLFRRPERYLQNLEALKERLAEIGRLRPVSAIPAEAGGEFVAHLLRVFGFPGAEASTDGKPLVLYRPQREDVSRASEFLYRGGSVVAVLPAVGFAKAFAVTSEARSVDSPRVLRAEMAGQKPWKRLRTLHSYMRFVAAEGVPVVTDDEGRAAWLSLRTSAGGALIFVGTDIVSDLVRYRQGDPAAANKRPTEPLWGIAGERPNYLFEGQLAGENPRERHADWWCEALSDALTRLCGETRLPMLPNGAPGAIVITGDDDQAGLGRYAQQLEALGPLPVTYFLHPLTKHTPETLVQLKSRGCVELGLHPDALEEPEKYAELFSEQANWFKQLTGEDTRTVRNHGFLNDGYWEHAKSWNAHGVKGSSNLPGLDGRMLNGSLLPARLLLDDKLTGHWSILTAIGDGIVFVHGWNDDQSADCIFGLADDIRKSGVPGVIVVNLHPENIDKTRGMHHAVRKVVDDGFVPWTMSECLEWFERRPEQRQPDVRPAFSWARLLRRRSS
ncbi:GNAT family N-acetyltransferase [Bradyrhizobium sp. ma5]|uniref:GNAT family N-acetyltransferase n=1 Tax=Bradyrhizobium sp. ma5 TaxID=3344828 RepID=UPI0035D452B1